MEENRNYENETTETGNECKSGNKAGLAALVAGGVLAVGGLAVAGVKKLKGKKADKKAGKKKYKWIRVEADDIVEEEEIVEETETK